MYCHELFRSIFSAVTNIAPPPNSPTRSSEHLLANVSDQHWSGRNRLRNFCTNVAA